MKFLRSVIFMAATICIISGYVYSDNAGDAFVRGNKLYNAGDYKEAVRNYEKAISLGLNTGNLYYDLGNAYLKAGELGRSIAAYERALVIMPSDRDLLSNYNYAKSLMKRPDPPDMRSAYLQLLDLGMSNIKIVHLYVALICVFYLLVLWIILTVVLGKWKRASRSGIIVLSVLFIALYIPARQKTHWLRSGAVVVSDIIDARLEPLSGATVNFPLYGGMRVYILRQRGDWYKVRRPDGAIGWLPGKSLQKVSPSHRPRGSV